MADEPEIMGYSYKLPLEQPAKPRQGWRVANLKRRWQRRLFLVVCAVPVFPILLVSGIVFGICGELRQGYLVLRDVWKL